jgi:hypothetical protein
MMVLLVMKRFEATSKSLIYNVLAHCCIQVIQIGCKGSRNAANFHYYGAKFGTTYTPKNYFEDPH